MASSGTPQRRWQATCPNCGAPVEFASAASASAVCGFCRSTLLREGESLRKIGASAELFDDHSPLQLGAAGRYAGAAFSLVGRLQLSYAEGSWNEWHALFDNGPDGQKSAWLSEDNGSYVLGFEAPPPAGLPQAHELVLGAQLLLAGQAWTVSALTLARQAAAQGELPHAPLGDAQRQFLVAELRNNSADEVASLEYSGPPGSAPSWSLGRPVRLADLAMSGLREDAQGEAISSKTLIGKTCECPSCGAALAPKLDGSQSIVCAQCHAVVDISKGLGQDLAWYAQQANTLEPLIPLGRSGTLALAAGGPALPWQVVGYLERCDLPAADSEDEQSFWREYLLYNRSEGFAFLVDTHEGWSLVRPLTGAPKGSGSNTVEWQGRRFKALYEGESYAAQISYVLGEFYWQLRRGERAQVTDYEWRGEGRVELLSREQTGSKGGTQEISWSHGRKLDAAEVARAFKLAVSTAALTRDAAPTSGHGLVFKILLTLFILFILVMLMRGCSQDDCQSYKQSFGEASNEYRECQRRASGSGVRLGTGGGSYGGYSGGGGHK